MRYLSTRGHPDRRRFCDILLEGLAPDGGLYLPEHYPQVDAAMLAKWRTLPYAELAFEILSLYIDDIPPADLKAMCAKTYTAEVFGSDEIVPLRELEDGVYLEGLSNGLDGNLTLFSRRLDLDGNALFGINNHCVRPRVVHPSARHLAIEAEHGKQVGDYGVEHVSPRVLVASG